MPTEIYQANNSVTAVVQQTQRIVVTDNLTYGPPGPQGPVGPTGPAGESANTGNIAFDGYIVYSDNRRSEEHTSELQSH